MSRHLCSYTLLVSALLAGASCSQPGREAEKAPGPEQAARPGGPEQNAQPVAAEPGKQVAADSGPSKTAAEAAADNNALGLDLYKRVAQPGKNTFLSPHSVAVALAMTYEGARGATAAQMSESLRFEVSPERLRPGFEALREAIRPAEDAGYTLQVGSSLWGMQGKEFLPGFLEVLRTDYEAPLHQVDFAESEAARATINDWVAEVTRGKIDELIPPGLLDAMTRLVLVNAIYFKGDWAARFDVKATKTAPFQVLQGKPVRTPLMHQVAEFGYRELEDAQVLSLPYQGEELSMVVVLPRQADGLTALEAALDAASLKEWTEDLEQRKVSVFLPRFKIEAAFSLSEALAALGMKDAFDPKVADLSGMDGTRELYLKEVVHKSFVEVNEEGTEAAAATGAVVGVRSVPPPPPEFRADRPFLFFIRHEGTGAILFIGRVANPAS